MSNETIGKEPAGEGEQMVYLYTSYSRVNTDFLKETLQAAGIPYVCQLIGGLLGRGSMLGTGIFNPSNEDALFYVSEKFFNEAEQIKIQITGDEQEIK